MQVNRIKMEGLLIGPLKNYGDVPTTIWQTYSHNSKPLYLPIIQEKNHYNYTRIKNTLILQYFNVIVSSFMSLNEQSIRTRTITAMCNKAT